MPLPPAGLNHMASIAEGEGAAEGSQPSTLDLAVQGYTLDILSVYVGKLP